MSLAYSSAPVLCDPVNAAAVLVVLILSLLRAGNSAFIMAGELAKTACCCPGQDPTSRGCGACVSSGCGHTSP